MLCEGCTVTTGEKERKKKIDVGWKQPSVAGQGTCYATKIMMLPSGLAIAYSEAAGFFA